MTDIDDIADAYRDSVYINNFLIKKASLYIESIQTVIKYYKIMLSPNFLYTAKVLTDTNFFQMMQSYTYFQIMVDGEEYRYYIIDSTYDNVLKIYPCLRNSSEDINISKIIPSLPIIGCVIVHKFNTYSMNHDKKNIINNKKIIFTTNDNLDLLKNFNKKHKTNISEDKSVLFDELFKEMDCYLTLIYDKAKSYIIPFINDICVIPDLANIIFKYYL